MISKGWLLSICMITVFTEISSQSCSQLHDWLLEMIMDNMAILNSKMTCTFHLECLDDILTFYADYGSLRNIDVSDTQNAKVAIHEILLQMSHIFNQNHTELARDKKSITDLLIGLHQQTEALGRCLRAFPRDQRFLLTRVSVKRYFKRLSDLLKEKEYSHCAWEIVWIQVRQTFVLVHQFTKRIRNEA